MKRNDFVLLGLSLFSGACVADVSMLETETAEKLSKERAAASHTGAEPAHAASGAVSPAAIAYPKAARGDVVEDYHGTPVADPYRWLEDPDSPETRAWVEAENKITFDFLEHIPERTELKQRLTELWNFERFGLPQSGKGHYVWSRNDGLQPQAVIYTSEGAKGEPRVLL
ncbi:MAG: hypothetical protein ABI054_09690, partial [Planctomycetota bacterium]